MVTTPPFHAKEQARWALVAKQFARVTVFGENLVGRTAVAPPPLPAVEEKAAVRRINREELVAPAAEEAALQIPVNGTKPEPEGKDVPALARPQGLFTVDPRAVTAGHFFTQLTWSRRSLDVDAVPSALENDLPDLSPPAAEEPSARVILSSQIPWGGRGLEPKAPNGRTAYQDAEIVLNRSGFSEAATTSALSSAKKIASRGKGSLDPYSPQPAEFTEDSAGAFFRNLNWNTPQQKN